ncbi:hypothetical protein Hanom_Chr09g00788261 [Helianthus anomalus]
MCSRHIGQVGLGQNAVQVDPKTIRERSGRDCFYQLCTNKSKKEMQSLKAAGNYKKKNNNNNK